MSNFWILTLKFQFILFVVTLHFCLFHQTIRPVYFGCNIESITKIGKVIILILYNLLFITAALCGKEVITQFKWKMFSHAI